MEDDAGLVRPPNPGTATPPRGGVVEPIKRPGLVKEFQSERAALDPPGRHYEFLDPFANVKHRAQTFDEMVAKADRAGALRFIAIDADTSRTPVHKVDGQWQRPAALQPTVTIDPAEAVRITKTAAEINRDREAQSVPRPAAGESARPHEGEPTAERIALKSEAAFDREAEVARLRNALSERYLIKKAPLNVGDVSIGSTEYRWRGDATRVAFTASTFRLATDTNSPSVARSMVDVARTRGWSGLRVSGNEDFKRMVWLEATVRNVRTVGYEPSVVDLEMLKKERESRLVNRIEPMRDAAGAHLSAGRPAETSPSAAEKGNSARGGSRKAVLAAIEALLIAKQVPQARREAVMAAATEKLLERARNGQSAPRVRVYDKSAAPQRTVPVPTPELQRSRDRTVASPAR